MLLSLPEKPAEPIALVDLDGTLCDFDGAMARGLGALRSPAEDLRLDDTMYEDVPHIKARRRLIKSQPGFWRNLAPLSLGFAVLQEIRQLRFRPYVLTKGPANAPLAWSEKLEWCRQHVPDLPVIISEDKGLVYGKMLVDDWPAYIARWIEWRPRGAVIAVAQPWNVDIEQQFPNHVIRYDGSNLDRVRERLQAVRATAGD